MRFDIFTGRKTVVLKSCSKSYFSFDEVGIEFKW